MALTDYPILGAPTISRSSFLHVLQNAGSPMAAESNAIYDAYVRHGVNPAIGLAIALHESSFGKAGIAVGRKDPYGLRWYPNYAASGGWNKGGWAAFSTYAAAANAHAGLLASSSYGGSSKYGTARTFPYRYAPSSDGNSPKSYGNAIVSALTRWGATGGIPYTGAPAGSVKSKPKPKKATTKAAAPAVPSRSKAAAAGVGIGAAVVLALIL